MLLDLRLSAKKLAELLFSSAQNEDFRGPYVVEILFSDDRGLMRAIRR
jgi:hypothetical protein